MMTTISVHTQKHFKNVAGWLLPVGLLTLVLSPLGSPCRAQQQPGADAQETSKPVSEEPAAQASPTIMIPHPGWDRLWISGQANFIMQWHPSFHSPYQGKNSLTPEAQNANSRVLTLFTGLRMTRTAEFLCDVQETGGHGLGEALGVAGFFNLDVVRNPLLSKAPYIARLMWHQIIPLGEHKIPVQRSPYSLFRELPRRRLELRFGKFSMADFFDLNTYGTDSNLQFMNWAVDNNGGYDYAADTRGFTFAAMAEYHDRNYVLRFAEALMPKVANGIHLDADMSRAHSENFEFELHGKALGKREGIIRLLAYVNRGNMGVYREAVANFLSGRTTIPDITAHPLQSTVKYGFGINFEQQISDSLGVFGRWGWNEGGHESFAYTEVDQTWQIGIGGNGGRWGRRYDRLGLVYVSNGISRDHQQYLALGGYVFLLGDGRLNYAREDILEGFYTLHAWKGFFPSAGLQYAVHPGYNKDRGPVIVPTLRLHVEF